MSAAHIANVKHLLGTKQDTQRTFMKSSSEQFSEHLPEPHETADSQKEKSTNRLERNNFVREHERLVFIISLLFSLSFASLLESVGEER